MNSAEQICLRVCFKLLSKKWSQCSHYKVNEVVKGSSQISPSLCSGTTNHLLLARQKATFSEEHEDLLDVTFNVLNLLSDDVESNSLGEGSALTDGDNITSTESECWGAVDGDSSMSLLESVVLLDVVQVVTSDDNGSVHLSGDNNTPNNILIIIK